MLFPVLYYKNKKTTTESITFLRNFHANEDVALGLDFGIRHGGAVNGPSASGWSVILRSPSNFRPAMWVGVVISTCKQKIWRPTAARGGSPRTLTASLSSLVGRDESELPVALRYGETQTLSVDRIRCYKTGLNLCNSPVYFTKLSLSKHFRSMFWILGEVQNIMVDIFIFVR